MKRVITIHARALLPTFLLVVLLGAQSLQAVHLHVDHPTLDDCLQCQVDSWQAVLPVTSAGPAALVPASNDHPAVSLAPVSTHYRFLARGPPSFSC